MIAIVGGSGSSKTTLLRHIIGLEQPDRGRALVADHESEGSPLVDLATLDAAGHGKSPAALGSCFPGQSVADGKNGGLQHCSAAARGPGS